MILAEVSQEAIDFSILFLRVVAGLTMAAHGYNKIFGGGRIPGTAGWFESIGFKGGTMQAWAAALTEIGTGVMLAAGFLTPLAGAGFVGLMTVAIVTVHAKNGFFIVAEGIEYNVILAAVGIAIAGTGPGKYSLDRALSIDDTLSGWLGLAIAVGGIVVAALQLAIFWTKPAQDQ